jgi:hypothetical protein
MLFEAMVLLEPAALPEARFATTAITLWPAARPAP